MNSTDSLLSVFHAECGSGPGEAGKEFSAHFDQGKSSRSMSRQGGRSRSRSRSRGFSRSPRRSPVRQRSPSPVKVNIRNLSKNVNEGHVREIFGQFGKLASVRVEVNREHNIPLGRGWVEYTGMKAAQEAVNVMDGGQIDGNIVKCSISAPSRSDRRC